MNPGYQWSVCAACDKKICYKWNFVEVNREFNIEYKQQTSLITNKKKAIANVKRGTTKVKEKKREEVETKIEHTHNCVLRYNICNYIRINTKSGLNHNGIR